MRGTHRKQILMNYKQLNISKLYRTGGVIEPSLNPYYFLYNPR